VNYNILAKINILRSAWVIRGMKRKENRSSPALDTYIREERRPGTESCVRNEKTLLVDPHFVDT
jgi:hypothetical protein